MSRVRGNAMREDYVFVGQCPGLRWLAYVGIMRLRERTQMWTYVKVRIPHKCHRCGRSIHKGQMAWRPMTDALNRRDRLCTRCMRWIRYD